MTNLYALLAAALVWLASVLGAGWWAWENGRDALRGELAREDKAAREATDAALKVTAEAIGKIQVRNVHVTQKLDTITHEREVYRTCAADADGLRLVNEARTGRSLAAGAGELPASSAGQ